MSSRTRKPTPSELDIIRACVGEASALSDPRKLRGAGTRCRNLLVKGGTDFDLAERCAAAALSVAHAVRMAEQRVRMRMRLLAVARGLPTDDLFGSAR